MLPKHSTLYAFPYRFCIAACTRWIVRERAARMLADTCAICELGLNGRIKQVRQTYWERGLFLQRTWNGERSRRMIQPSSSQSWLMQPPLLLYSIILLTKQRQFFPNLRAKYFHKRLPTLDGQCCLPCLVKKYIQRMFRHTMCYILFQIIDSAS